MTNRDRDSLASLLRSLSARMAAMPKVVEERAETDTGEMHHAELKQMAQDIYIRQALALGLRDFAGELQSYVDEYLAAKPKPRRSRGRR